jgi:hypothetical protein
MPDRTNSPQEADPADPAGPWPVCVGLAQVHDTGMQWCTNAAGHPNIEGGYPDAGIHVPAFECRTRGTTLDGVRAGLDGPAATLEVYAGRPYRYGLPRLAHPSQTRLILEFVDEPNELVHRFSLAPGDALRLSHLLPRLIDHITDL